MSGTLFGELSHRHCSHQEDLATEALNYLFQNYRTAQASFEEAAIPPTAEQNETVARVESLDEPAPDPSGSED